MIGIRGVMRDVTMDHLAERQITFYAYYDNLTGLPNRLRLEETLQRALSRMENEEQNLALGFIDLDNFSQINEMLGYRIGDRLLILIADRLRDALGAGEILFHWGGDKFIIVLTEVPDNSFVYQTGKRLMETCRSPIDLGGEKIHLSYSIGFSIYPEDGLTIDNLLGEADRALSYAKSQGRYNFQLATDLPRRGFYREQLQIRNNLTTAIDEKQIQAYFQPKVDAHTHAVIGMEALARWPDQEGNFLVSPGLFIPVAENLGLIKELGRLILEQSLAFIKETNKILPGLKLCVNVSRRQLFEATFVENLLEIVHRFDVQPENLMLEITESIAMLEVEFALERLRALASAGFQLSIDDFGTGYSTLAQLHEMPVHELKIDMSFIRRIDTYEGMQVVQAITNMGRALQLDVVAEGVESSAHASRLAKAGVNILQGNYFSPSLAPDEFIKYLNKSI